MCNISNKIRLFLENTHLFPFLIIKWNVFSMLKIFHAAKILVFHNYFLIKLANK